MRTVLVAVVFALLVALHFTLRPLLDWRAGVDFLVIGLLLVAVRVRPAVAALIGLVLGLAADAMSPESLGAGALAMTLLAFAASRLKEAFFADDLLINAIFVVVGKVFFDVIFLLAKGQTGGTALLMQLFVWTPVAAIVTAVVGLALMAVIRPALEQRRMR